MVKSAYHRTIDKLPLSVFIDVACDDDFRALVIEGEPEDAELIQAWADIVQQYNDALTEGTPETVHTIGLYRNVIRTDYQLKAAETFIRILRDLYVEQFARELNKIVQSKFAFDVHDPEKYDADLKMASTRLGGLRLRIALESARIKNKVNTAQDKEIERPQRGYFINLLLNLSDHAGYDIREDQITVRKFCERVKRYNQAIERLKTMTPATQKGFTNSKPI